MTEFLLEYGMFLAKIVTFVVAAIVIIAAIVNASHKSQEKEGHLEIKKLNEKLKAMKEAMLGATLDQHSMKARHKQEKKREKEKAKQEKKSAKKASSAEEAGTGDKKVFVLDFHGDIRASAVDHLREEITAVLAIATTNDEVVVRLESSGGMVHAYGLAASQIARIKSAGIPLTICVDKVAASGGYMMACIGDRILAAPFAVIGSIGVVASMPNFNRVLKNHDVDYEMHTAGEYKRTLTMLGENTQEGRKKFLEELEDTHVLFKDFVAEQRPALTVSEVATGETWYGRRALEHQLVDELATSDEYLGRRAEDAAIYHVKYVQKKHWQEKLGMAAEAALERSFLKLVAQGMSRWNTRY